MLVRASELDQVRLYRVADFIDHDELVTRLRDGGTSSRATEVGTAWHSVLEDPPEGPIEMIERDGILFEVACEAELALPQVREIRAEKAYRVSGRTVTVTGKVDGITGSLVTDHKLTGRPEMEKFANSLQWRAYLDIFGASICEHMVFHGDDKGEVVRIVGVHPFRQYRYPEMEADLMAGLQEFVSFCERYVPERLEAPEAVPGLDDLSTGIQREAS